jgi:chromosome segregation ATPase
MSYHDKYLKYKAKYEKLKHLEKLYQNKDWLGIIKVNETKYKEAITALRENERKLQELVNNQTIANNNYYKDISNKENEKTLKHAKYKVDELTAKISKLQKLVDKTNKTWKDSITNEMKAKVRAAQQDVDAGKSYLAGDKKNVDRDRGIVEKTKEGYERAISNLNKDIISSQQSEAELAKTVKILNRVHQEQSDTLAGLEARTAAPPAPVRNNNNNNNNNNDDDEGDD